MADGVHARPRRAAGAAVVAVITAALAFALDGCSATAPSPSPDDAAPHGAPTLRSLIEAEAENPTFELVQETTDYDGDPAEVVAYRSGGLDVQAVIRRPVGGDASSPAIVFVHGDVDPDDYSGLTVYDEFADAMVDAGYVVVSPDLRNHGDSDDDPTWETDMDVGSTLDAINAARAIAADPMVDPGRIAMAGHSHGGSIVVSAAAVAPDVASAFVAAAPSHPSPWENVERFTAGTPYFETVVAAHGTPEESPDYWRDVSSLTFLDRADDPLLLVHGTEDDTVPFEWSEALLQAWNEAGGEAALVPIEGADHFFDPEPELLYAAITEFLAEQLA